MYKELEIESSMIEFRGVTTNTILLVVFVWKDIGKKLEEEGLPITSW